MKPLEDVRIIARRAVRRRPVRQRAPGRPGRRGHQDRGPARRRRRRPLRPAVRRGRGLALLRDLQPQQAQSLSLDLNTPAGRAVFEDLVEGQRRRLLQPARRRAGEDRHHLRRPQAPQPGDRVLLADRLRHDRPARQGARLRLRPPGPGRLDGRSPASPTARRPSPACRWSTSPAATSPRSRCSPGCTPPAATASAWTATSPLRHRDDDADLPGAPGTSTPASRPSAPATPRTRRWCRSRPSRPRTAGSSSAAPRRSSGRGWPRSSATRSGRAGPARTRPSPAAQQQQRRAARRSSRRSSRPRTVDEWLSRALPGRRSRAARSTTCAAALKRGAHRRRAT